MLKALDEDIKEVQTMQLRESTIATSSKNNVAVNAFSNYVDNYRKIEYILRDIACKLRKLVSLQRKIILFAGVRRRGFHNAKEID